ncbi:HAD-IB family phosphatase [Limnoglobus roseus]|uniref:phosphoserine phosphatase n=1 Tax=Limnoglobus roseus TaxID=2598579 RepID=A0A5C1AB86_9BACT|nr:HAD-IB family phosphatase [Limnoglobus roseus]QEL15980.1 2-hydroxy-3-keto-5-methylthiopentenyl-1- phosphate phosphatase [Limnoglobus roseus]
MDAAQPRRVFVTDFDGTFTRHDFYNLFLEQLYPADAPDQWAAFSADKITHFECLRNIYAHVPVGEEKLRAFVQQLYLLPEVPAAVARLKAAGWEVVVASAGSRWYIEQVLAAAGLNLPVHTNHGRIVDGRLLMELPTDSPFFHPHAGIDKAAVVRSFLDAGCEVAFAGDGITDIPPALLVPPRLRFATGFLARKLTERGEAFHSFTEWCQAAEVLLEK